MLSKIGAKILNTTKVNMMGHVAHRTAYTDATKPHVFINQHTKVLVQGMTGKHVSSLNILSKKQFY